MRTAASVTSHSSSGLTMESLALPKELIWDGKMEPTSPPSQELFSIAELPDGHWIYDDDFANGFTSITVDDLDLKCIEGLGHVEDLIVEFRDLKEENWNDSKLQAQLVPIGSVIAHPNPITKVPGPLSFEIFKTSSPHCAETILTQLTPPHSPPQNVAAATSFTADGAAISTGIFQQHANLGALNFQHELSTAQEQQLPTIAIPSTPILPPNNQINYPAWIGSSIGSSVSVANANTAAADDYSDDVMALDVDEFLQDRVKELDDCSDEYASWPSPSQASSVISDDDWQPSCSSSASSSPSHQLHSGNSSSSFSQTDADDERLGVKSERIAKKRTRPYGRGIEDRKIRKKEQNKNAATRYRQKKKIEMEIVHNEEQELSNRNAELKRVLAECTREAKYLRSLIREFHQKKP